VATAARPVLVMTQFALSLRNPFGWAAECAVPIQLYTTPKIVADVLTWRLGFIPEMSGGKSDLQGGHLRTRLWMDCLVARIRGLLATTD